MFVSKNMFNSLCMIVYGMFVTTHKSLHLVFFFCEKISVANGMKGVVQEV